MHYLQPQMLVALLITDVHEKKKRKRVAAIQYILSVPNK